MATRNLSRLFASGAAALALSLAGAAHAAVYELKFIGEDVSGDVFATTVGSNVTAIRGTVSDSDVGPGAFLVTGLSPYASSDNTLAGASWLTLGGLSFTTAGGGDYNLANLASYDGRGDMFLSSVLDPGGYVSDIGMTPITLTVTSVPEPGNVALLLAGMLGLFGAARRRALR